jgi:hypothetical protein
VANYVQLRIAVFAFIVKRFSRFSCATSSSDQKHEILEANQKTS